MLESGLSGSVRGVPSNGHPYRDTGGHTLFAAVGILDEAGPSCSVQWLMGVIQRTISRIASMPATGQ